ncbi:head decoration protein [Vibrio cholerae]|nr:head decoration protein [Vibrio cholerae]
MKEAYQAADNFVLQGEPETSQVLLKAGQGVIAARTPLKYDSTAGAYVKAVAADKATRLTAYDVDTTAGAKAAQVYKRGQFNIGAIQFDAALTTDADKYKQFEGSEISVGRPYAS